jgi:hypothetical protein
LKKAERFLPNGSSFPPSIYRLLTPPAPTDGALHNQHTRRRERPPAFALDVRFEPIHEINKGRRQLNLPQQWEHYERL